MELTNLFCLKKLDVKDGKNLYKNIIILKQNLNIMLTNYYQHLPYYDLNIGGKEIEMANLCNILGCLDEAEDHIEKAKDILQVRLGKNHPLINKKWNKVRQEINMNRRQMKNKTRKKPSKQ